jgi:adenine-specific DNA-methyltransferase
VGDPITPDVDRFSIPSLDGCETVFPVKDDGTEMMWGILPSECKRRLQKGYVKVGKYSPEKPQQYSLQFLTSGTIAAIENGEAIITGHRKDGSVIAVYNSKKKILPKTQWAKESHDATRYGTKMLTEILGKRFNYPKSLYAVADCLRYFVANNPNALILDFFAGSGTTMHAVNLLNTEDDGKRRCILVTNNEVSDEEAKDLTAKGYKQGDDEWEKLGIANYVTWQRTKCSILGQDINGNPLKGNYISSNLPMSDGFKANASFFKLGFLDKTSVSLGRQLRELIPVLWMKAGAIGECPSIKGNEDIAIFSSNKFALLVNESEYSTFEAELNNHPEIEVVYIITNSEAGYREMIANLKVKQTYQLYRDYLDNFSINYSK